MPVDVGGVRESFLASHMLWTPAAYQDDWARNHRRLLRGEDCYFVTSMLPRQDGALIWLWPVVHHHGKILATQMFLSAETTGERFAPGTLSELIDFNALRSMVGSDVSFFEVHPRTDN